MSNVESPSARDLHTARNATSVVRAHSEWCRIPPFVHLDQAGVLVRVLPIQESYMAL